MVEHHGGTGAGAVAALEPHQAFLSRIGHLTRAPQVDVLLDSPDR